MAARAPGPAGIGRVHRDMVKMIPIPGICLILSACMATGLVHPAEGSTGTTVMSCHYRNHGQLPDPRCTPGAVNPAVTQTDIYATICKKGWTRTVRQPESVTERYKYDVAYPAYGVPRSEQTRLDDLIPLELGGKSAPANWWPEQVRSSYAKDRVENALNDAVCSGRVTLKAAQRAIVSNWMTAEVDTELVR